LFSFFTAALKLEFGQTYEKRTASEQSMASSAEQLFSRTSLHQWNPMQVHGGLDEPHAFLIKGNQNLFKDGSVSGSWNAAASVNISSRTQSNNKEEQNLTASAEQEGPWCAAIGCYLPPGKNSCYAKGLCYQKERKKEKCRLKLLDYEASGNASYCIDMTGKTEGLGFNGFEHIEQTDGKHYIKFEEGGVKDFDDFDSKCRQVCKLTSECAGYLAKWKNLYPYCKGGSDATLQTCDYYYYKSQLICFTLRDVKCRRWNSTGPCVLANTNGGRSSTYEWTC
jgi:hypothetical protein